MAGGGEPLAIGTKTHGVDQVGMPFQSAQLLTIGGVPDFYRLIQTGGREPGTIGAVRYFRDLIAMPF